jgi:protein-histidine pros-kinase
MLNDTYSTPDHCDIVARHRQIANDALDGAETWARQRKCRSAISSLLPEAMLVVDETGIIISVNSQFELMFGYHRSEIIGQSPELLLPLAARARHIQHRMYYAHRAEVREMAHGTKILARHKNGTEFKVMVNLGPVVVPAGLHTIVSIRSVWA